MNRPEELSACLSNLRELDRFLAGLPEGAYGRRVEALEASIGGHCRHLLEHYLTLAELEQRGCVHFEDRRRDARLAQDRDEARACLGRVLAWLEGGCDGKDLDQAVTARVSLDGRLEEAVSLDSSFRRELIYAFLHGVHHQALIAVAGRLQGLPVPPDLGKAPATRVFEAAS